MQFGVKFGWVLRSKANLKACLKASGLAWIVDLSMILMGMVSAGAAASLAEEDHAQPQIAEVGIVGDSLSTGAVTNPALAFDGQLLWDIFNGKVVLQPKSSDLPVEFRSGGEPVPPAPQRLWPSSREFFGGPDWIWRHTLQSLSRTYLDTAEYSWGYMVGRGLGVPPHDIVLAGEDGARLGQLPRHLDRLLNASEGVLPKRLFIYYTGNDLCGANLGEVTTDEEFAADLRLGLRYLLSHATAAPGGSDVYLMSQLGVLQLLTSESILSKKVRAFGMEITCRELRNQGFRPTEAQAAEIEKKAQSKADANSASPGGHSPLAWYFSLVMPPSPAGFCTTLFGSTTDKDRDVLISTLANHIRSYRESAAKIMEEFQTQAQQQHVRLHFIKATATLDFVGEDIAQDCFHLSIQGQTKLARSILSEVGAL